MDNTDDLIREILKENSELNNNTVKTVCEKYNKSIEHIVKMQMIKDVIVIGLITIMFCSFIISYFNCDYSYTDSTNIQNTNTNNNTNTNTK